MGLFYDRLVPVEVSRENADRWPIKALARKPPVRVKEVIEERSAFP